VRRDLMLYNIGICSYANVRDIDIYDRLLGVIERMERTCVLDNSPNEFQILLF
jgi:hypothetical protein